MLVQVNTDNNIAGSEGMHKHFEETVSKTLHRFDEMVTRVEVFLKDVDAGKSGTEDKHCSLEARIKGLDPITATHESDDLHNAVRGAADKMKTMLAKIQDKRKDH